MNEIVTATIAMTSNDPGNVIELVANDPNAMVYDPPVWEKELSAPAERETWGPKEADRVLAENGYRREGQWWISTRTTGYPSWTADVEATDAGAANLPSNLGVPDSAA